MHHLYLRIYLAMVAVLIIFAGLAALAWWLGPGRDHEERALIDGAAHIMSEVIPGPERPKAELEAALTELSQRFGNIALSVHALDGTLLGATGTALPPPEPDAESGWQRGPRIALRLPDGRWLSAAHEHRHRLAWLWALLLLAVAVGIVAHPLARRLTRRLEKLERGVERLGAGDLSARVDVEGRDEVADLAASFNHAAQRIEELVGSQRALLAAASHELRSPLARIRMALSLMGEAPRAELAARMERDIGELDELIDELLTASRLRAMRDLEPAEEIDLLALAAEEAARVGATVSGTAATLEGSPRLLRRLLRNLLENARRHGGEGINASVEPIGGGARILVSDGGPGVPASERERIFEPFYRPPGMRETGEGAGLGLALVREIAEKHRGFARCLASGEGTVFEVELHPMENG